VVEDELTRANGSSSSPPYPAIAVDRHGRVYAGFQDAREGDPDLYVWSLESRGRLGGPVRVNDTEPGDGTASTGRLAVAPDGRLDVVTTTVATTPRTSSTRSLPGLLRRGESFSERIPISESFSSRIGFGQPGSQLGSRLGLVSTDDRALAVWSDTRAGTVRTASRTSQVAWWGSATAAAPELAGVPAALGRDRADRRRGRVFLTGGSVWAAPLEARLAFT
jgi:hypothetical protein